MYHFLKEVGCFLPRKDRNKLQHTGQQAVYRTSALEMNAGHVLCCQHRMKQLDSGLSQITVGHIAHECLINQTYRSITFHYEETKSIRSDTP